MLNNSNNNRANKNATYPVLCFSQSIRKLVFCLILVVQLQVQQLSSNTNQNKRFLIWYIVILWTSMNWIIKFDLLWYLYIRVVDSSTEWRKTAKSARKPPVTIFCISSLNKMYRSRNDNILNIVFVNSIMIDWAEAQQTTNCILYWWERTECLLVRIFNFHWHPLLCVRHLLKSSCQKD